MPTVTTSGGAGILHIGNATDGPPVLLSAAGARARRVTEGAAARPGWEHRAIAMAPRTCGELEKVPFGHRMARRAAGVQDLVRALDSEESRPSAGRAGRTICRTTGSSLDHKELQHEYLGVRFNPM